MRSIPGVHGAPSEGARKRLRGVVCGALLILTLCLATACGSSSDSSDKFPLPSGAKPPSIKNESPTPWFPGVFLVAVVSTDPAVLHDSNALTGLSKTLEDISSTNPALAQRTWRTKEFAGAADAPGASGKPEAFLPFGNVAIASYRLVSAGKTDESAADLMAQVNAINETINAAIDHPTDDAVKDAVLAHKAFSVGSATVWLAGATPDLLGEGSGLD